MTENPPDADEQGGRKRGRPVQMCPRKRETLVLDCAMELLSERAPDEVTMADIARRAGMSKRTLYTLYRSREELLGAGLARMSRRCSGRCASRNATRRSRTGCGSC
ncbi:helix-turn-helix domain-containing protein [Citreimonas sp.]|uniref:helix-turn-helix domain-containing protein n=1 Tax=Citreimonas sp. TaxID=3036715 RepID=UPI004059E35E